MEPWLVEPAAVARLCPAADRDTPDDNVRSSASSIAATIGGAVHPVTPAKQTLTMGPTLSSHDRRGSGPGTASLSPRVTRLREATFANRSLAGSTPGGVEG